MDHFKEALKKKMGKVVNIQISVDPVEAEKKTDLAPDVKDSDEPGVEKDEIRDMQEIIPGGEPEGDLPMGQDFMQALINQSPDHPAGGKTLESIAKERAQKRMKNRAQPIQDEQMEGLPFRKRK